MLAAVQDHALMAEGPIVIAEAAQPVLLLNGDQKITVARGSRKALVKGRIHLVERDAARSRSTASPASPGDGGRISAVQAGSSLKAGSIRPAGSISMRKR